MSDRPLLFVVDDTEDSRYALSRTLAHNGYEVEEFDTGLRVLARAKERRPALILLDVMMPRQDGFETTRQLKEDAELRFVPILLVTAKDSLEDIVYGLDLGADDYLIKPFRNEELLARVRAALRLRALYEDLKVTKEENAALIKEASTEGREIVGHGPAIKKVLEIVDKIAPAQSAVLITGESGTGKELVARAVHMRSPRKAKSFIARNCAAFNESLLESELFGHIKGSFTGAVRDQRGVFEAAHGGTLFLDEIGEMSPALQAKMLRVLQEGTFSPVGTTAERSADVRVVAATHRDLLKMVQEGKFREDLYYRLNVLHLHLPPLRERKEDLPALLENFLEQLRVKGRKSIAPDVVALFEGYHWPGNIRELRNEIERMVILSGESLVMERSIVSDRILGSTPFTKSASGKLTLREAVEQLEREMIAQALSECEGNRSNAAKQLGMSRSNLISKIQSYGLK